MGILLAIVLLALLADGPSPAGVGALQTELDAAIESGADARSVTALRSALADALFAAGRYEEAREHQQRVIADLAPSPAIDQASLQDARLRLARTLTAVRDLEGARALAWPALSALEQQVGPDDPRVVFGRSVAGEICFLLDEFEAAGAHFAAVVDALRRSGSEADLLDARHNLAAAWAQADRTEDAIRELEEVLAVRLAREPATSPDLVRTRTLLGSLLAETGRYDRALGLLDEALTHASEGGLEDGAHDYLRDQRIELLARAGDVERAAEEAALLAGEIAERLLADVARVSLREAEERANGVQWILAALLSKGADLRASEPARERLRAAIFTASETARGIVSFAARARREATDAAEGTQVGERLRRAAAVVAELTAEGGSPERIAEAVRERDALEREVLRGTSPAVLADGVALSPAALGGILDEGTVLVAFRSYMHTRGGRGRPSLRAFVLTSSRPLREADLGWSVPVRDAVAAWRRRIASEPDDLRGLAPDTRVLEPGDARTAGAAVRALVLDPLLELLQGANRLLVLPDDELHLVPFEALPWGEEGADDLVLGDRFAVETLPDATELAGSVTPDAESRGLLAAGGIEYGGPASGFPALPGTGEEVRAVAALFERTHEVQPRILVGAQATAERLAREAPGVRYLHLATHGYARATGERTTEGLSPLALCGLALAGADATTAQGLVTGEVLATIDLHGCELAVLSACDTGLGRRREGLGVASLQRALHVAGARSVVTALWRVPDDATRDLMVELYRGLWARGLPLREALWQAKAALRERGAPVRDWGAWVLTGPSR